MASLPAKSLPLRSSRAGRPAGKAPRRARPTATTLGVLPVAKPGSPCPTDSHAQRIGRQDHGRSRSRVDRRNHHRRLRRVARREVHEERHGAHHEHHSRHRRRGHRERHPELDRHRRGGLVRLSHRRLHRRLHPDLDRPIAEAIGGRRSGRPARSGPSGEEWSGWRGWGRRRRKGNSPSRGCTAMSAARRAESKSGWSAEWCRASCLHRLAVRSDATNGAEAGWFQPERPYAAAVAAQRVEPCRASFSIPCPGSWPWSPSKRAIAAFVFGPSTPSTGPGS